MATSAGTPGSPVEVGNPAPGFRLPATGKKEIGLADFRDRQHVVLAFYPFDCPTPICSCKCRRDSAGSAMGHSPQTITA